LSSPMVKRSDTSMNDSVGKGVLMAAVPEGELFTLREVAAWAKITVAMVRAMIARGELRAFKMGRLWRVRKEDLDDFLNRRLPPAEDPLC
jgi:excisionase family DNA binding protein